MADHLRFALQQAVLYQRGDMAGHGGAGARDRGVEFGIAAALHRREVEHQPVELRIGECKADIGFADRARALHRIGDRGQGRFQRRGEAVQHGGAHRGDDLVLILEIAVRQHRAAAQFRGQFAHGEVGAAAPFDQPFGGGAQLRLELIDL